MKTFKIINMDSVTSTNDVAKKMIKTENPSEFTVLSAKKQYWGRGQKLNSWHSKEGLNLIFSIILYPAFLTAVHQFYLSKVISVAIIDYLKTMNKSYKIKWPNDILFGNKKICGILIENSISGSNIKDSVIGIGLNINQKDFPEDLPFATSLALINNKDYLIDNELNELLDHIQIRYTKLLLEKKYDTIDLIYHKHLYRLNELCKYKDISGNFNGTILGTEQEGRLVIKTAENEMRKYNFKDIEFC